MRESEVVSSMPSHDMMSRLIMEKSSNALFSSRSVNNSKITKINCICNNCMRRQYCNGKSTLPAMAIRHFKFNTVCVSNIACNGNLTLQNHYCLRRQQYNGDMGIANDYNNSSLVIQNYIVCDSIQWDGNVKLQAQHCV